VPSNDSHYCSYLLRFWRDDEFSPWRAMVTDPVTGERHGFSSMAQLYAFLEEQTADGQEKSLNVEPLTMGNLNQEGK
jgi:hypothetical protein